MASRAPKRAASVGVAENSNSAMLVTVAPGGDARGWWVHWHNRDGVFLDAAAVPDRDDITPVLRERGRSIGPPWQAADTLAAAPAIVATGPPEPPRRAAAGRR